jgi:hypothetical protein
MPNYVDAFIGHDLFTTSNVNAYSLPTISSNVINQYGSGTDIGNIYSYVNGSDGNLYWMIYPLNDLSQTPFYILNDANELSIPDVNQPLTGINTNKPLTVVDTTPPIGQSISDTLSSVFSGIAKALPVILIGGAAILLLPSIIKSINEKRK